MRIGEPTVSPMTTITTAGEKRLWRLDNSGSKRASLPQPQQTKQLTHIICHCSEEKTRNRKCLEESLTSNALCTSNVQLLDQTEKALHGTLSNERLFCNEVNLNTASLDDDIQSLVDCQPEFFDEAENCARPFRDNFKTTAAAERISDQTCRFVCMGRKGREGKML